MADQFLAEIRAFGFNFAPSGWAQCNGQLMAISQNTALFSLLGTTYGGDGRSTFALPDLQGSVVIAPGQSAGGSLYDLGEMSGEASVTLLQTEMPSHPHTVQAVSSIADKGVPSANTAIARSSGGGLYTAAGTAALASMAPQALLPAGSSQPHNNLQPYLVLNYCIALQGVFPQRP